MYGDIRDVQHVIILMQENRSFDEYFGTFPEATGFSDPINFFNQPGGVLPFRLSTFTSTGEECPNTAHLWDDMHNDYADGNMDGWAEVNPGQPQVFGYYAADDIPYHWALAQAFALCDHYFCSALGPTISNRLYMMSGAIQDSNPGPDSPPPAINNPPQIPPGYTPCNPPPHLGTLNLDWPSYADELTNANVAWKIYDETCAAFPWLTEAPSIYNGWGDLNVLKQFSNWNVYANSGHIVNQGPIPPGQTGQFESDCLNGMLPTVSWIIPPFGASEWEDNHPSEGAYYIALKLKALLSSNLWNNTVFILTYDESGGHFDHVTPPVAPADASPPEQPVDGEPIGAGFRVPTIIISPWTVGAGVQTEYFDHTSLIQFLEQVTKAQGTPVVCENLPPAGYRRQTFGDFTSVFDFANPVASAVVVNMLPPASTVLGWKNNAETRLGAATVVPLNPPDPPVFPPVPQACAANNTEISSQQVLSAVGAQGTAAIPNAFTVVVSGFEPDEFIDINAGVPNWIPQSQRNPPVPGVPLQGGGSCDTRVPVITAVVGGGASPGELSFQCTQVDLNPNMLAAQASQAQIQGVPQQITFTFSVTFNTALTSFAFRSGTARISRPSDFL
jgi:phospholipase C